MEDGSCIEAVESPPPSNLIPFSIAVTSRVAAWTTIFSAVKLNSSLACRVNETCFSTECTTLEDDAASSGLLDFESSSEPTRFPTALTTLVVTCDSIGCVWNRERSSSTLFSCEAILERSGTVKCLDISCRKFRPAAPNDCHCISNTSKCIEMLVVSRGLLYRDTCFRRTAWEDSEAHFAKVWDWLLSPSYYLPSRVLSHVPTQLGPPINNGPYFWWAQSSRSHTPKWVICKTWRKIAMNIAL